MPTKKMVASVGGSIGALAMLVASASPALAHGYVQGPQSRAVLCKVGVNTDCGGVQYEPQSLEAPKGFPENGPADGTIASAGGLFGGKLDEQSSNRWAKTDIASGPVQFDWTFTAPHKTSEWRYYMTKPGWDPNAPITRAELQEIGVVKHDGSAASTNPSHVVTVPSDREGYHVILAVWDIADTVNAFYQVIDVNVTGQATSDVQAPSTPTDVRATSIESTSATLVWEASSDDVGVKGYVVYRDGVRVGSASGTSFTDQGLAPGSTYEYSVVATDRAGNASERSAALSVTTVAAPDVDIQAPTAPTHLHSMGVTQSSVALMWEAASDDVGVTSYLVYRDGAVIGTTSNEMLTDTGLAAGSQHSYVVKARDAAGNVSASSNTLTVTTQAAPIPEPGVTVWSDRGAYSKGDKVSFGGRTYECIQGYQGWGDPNWIHAPSLWSPIA